MLRIVGPKIKKEKDEQGTDHTRQKIQFMYLKKVQTVILK